MKGRATEAARRARGWLAAAAAGAGWLALLCEGAHANTSVELWPLLDLSGQYTDNLLLAPDAKSDEVATLVGGASLVLDNPHRRFQLDYLTDGQLYAEHTNFDRLAKDHYVGLHDEERLSETSRLSISDTFLDGQSVFGQTLIGSSGLNLQLGEALLQRNYQTNSFEGQLHQDLGASLFADFDLHQNTFATSTGSSSLSTNQGAYETVYYRLSGRLSAGAGGDFEDFRFSSQPRSDSGEPYLALRSDLTARIRLSAEAGPLISDTRSGASIDAGYAIAASYRAKHWSFELASSRAPGMTAGFGGAGINQSVYTTSFYRLTRRTGLYAYGGYNEVTGDGARTEIQALGAGVEHRLNRALSLYVQYLWFRSATPGSSTALTNSITVGARLDARPWHWSWR
ncbi:MAG TPA: hypothetical protein VNE82_11605 [Candidatus Binataceae bacterium]|nr:hypothetical protein [Candidatus Binataceae bacterium]